MCLYISPRSSGGEGDTAQSPLRSVFVDFGSRLSDGNLRRDAFARHLMHLAPSAAVCEWPSSSSSSSYSGGGDGSGGSGVSSGTQRAEEAARHWKRVVGGWTARWQRKEVKDLARSHVQK